MYNQIMIKILLAEDTPEWQEVQRTLLEKYFEKGSYSLTTALSAKEAFELLKKEKFDTVITDLQMEKDYEPDFAGEWLVKQIKQLPEYRDVPVIIVSATYNIAFIAENLGVKYLSKRTLLAIPHTFKYALSEILPLKNLHKPADKTDLADDMN